ncbi:RidA family protein [Halovivax cerinus]|uniref:RidA family protein n=1 Tax=Halovivax cerinus TaxID=1487865 RepID=A0ABD5NUD0_9EURY|nr:RidA family protein [Halovivax cerinus]
MAERQSYSTGTVFETEFGYNRAVRVGDSVRIAGTVAVEDGEVVAPGDPYEQASFALDRIEESLQEVGAEMSDVVITRVLVTDFADWEEIGRAHGEAFPDEKPASTMIGVDSLPEPGMVLEIEAEAIVSE